MRAPPALTLVESCGCILVQRFVSCAPHTLPNRTGTARFARWERHTALASGAVSAGSNPAGGTKLEHLVEDATAILSDPDPAQEQRSRRPFASTQRERHCGMLVDLSSPAESEWLMGCADGTRGRMRIIRLWASCVDR